MDKEIAEKRAALRKKFFDEPDYVLTFKDALILVCDTVEEVETIYIYDYIKKGIQNKTLTKKELLDFENDPRFGGNERSKFDCLNYIRCGNIKGETLNEEELKELNELYQKFYGNRKR